MKNIQVLIAGESIECILLEMHGRSEALVLDPIGRELWARKVKGVWVLL